MNIEKPVYIIFTCLVLFLIIFAIILFAQTASAQSFPTQTEIIQQKWIQISSEYGADRGVGLAIIESESMYNPTALGDKGTSCGLVQIHIPAHTEISCTQANDVDFSLTFLAENLIKGKCWIWSTCPLAKLE